MTFYLVYQVQGAVFDLPEEIAKELLNKELPPGNTVTKITKVGPVLLLDACTSQSFRLYNSCVLVYHITKQDLVVFAVACIAR